MKRMKRITAGITAVLMAASLTACSGNGNSSSSTAESSSSTTSTSSSSTSSSSSASTSSSSSASSSSSSSASSSSSSTESSSESTAESSSSITESKPEPKPEVEIKDGAELLNKVYGLFSEDEQFAACGGSLDNMVDNAAGMYTISEPDDIEREFCIPAAEVSKIDSAASLIHMMNQNTFTAGAYHLVSGADAAMIAKSIRENSQTRQWMCGFPDKIIVASVGDYLVSAYGYEELIDAFEKHLSEVYPAAKVIVNEPLGA